MKEDLTKRSIAGRPRVVRMEPGWMVEYTGEFAAGMNKESQCGV
jgi:regulatory protein YycH of two-component signal transduction system YycFG